MAHNVTHSLKGDILTITVNVSQKAIKDAPPSSTGKTKIVGGTGGYITVGEAHGASIGLSVNVTAK